MQTNNKMDNNVFNTINNCDTPFWVRNDNTCCENVQSVTGPGFLYAVVDSNCDLIIYRTDYTSFNAGSVACGDAKGIDYIILDSGNCLIVKYTDGTCQNIGCIMGPTGPCCTGPEGELKSFLLQIRRGQVTIGDIINESNKLQNQAQIELERHKNGTANFVQEQDINRVNKFLLNVRKEFWE